MSYIPGEMNYILDEEGNPLKVTNTIKWAQWFEEADRRVKQTEIRNVKVSTIFLGLDHNFIGKGAPILWETMVFGFPDGHELDSKQERYTSRADAVKGHDAMVVRVKRALHEVNG